jgi:diguanylate cyclase (GGDEF)-like protein
VACRFGGEEFIVLVSGDLQNGRETGQRLHKVIEDHQFATGAGVLRNTISIGVAHFPQHGQTGEEVIGAADLALYTAKSQGRNRVVCFEGRPKAIPQANH